ncbi:MAG: tyrosine-type recombinase/integrase [Bryobacteraceae bacterium]
MCELEPQFLQYIQVELQFAAQSVAKYQDCLRQIRKVIGDRPVTAYGREDVLRLKSDMIARSLSVCRQVGILSAFKRLLLFCREQLALPVLEPDAVSIPKRPRREVVFLTVEEVERFVSSIRLTTLRDQPSIHGLRFRALVEMLLGSAMRIGELLSLNRSDIDFPEREARIIGKGNKQRVVFFTERALFWLGRYLDLRTDDHPALFARQDGGERMKQPDIWRPFARHRLLAGINKPVRPHLLRHTAATQLLFNGCPVGHIKEILGHERLETTCRYYLGLDRRAAKVAHERFLVYEKESTGLNHT